MHRRAFLMAAAAAPVALAAERLRIAFLGASHSHAAAKIDVVKGSPDYELAGVWEEDPRVRAEIEKSGVKLLARDQILSDASIRVVAVESAVKPHFDHGLLALEAGKHIHLEKPPAWRRGDFEKLVDLARRKSLFIEMGYMWRYHAGFNTALEAARQGWLGGIYHVRGAMNTLIDQDRRPEWNLFHGGQMFEQGAHLIDPLVRLLGKPAKITPFLKSHGPYDDKLADDTVAVFEFPKALGVITSAVLQPNANAHRSFEILGYNGTAVLRPIEPPVLQIDLAKPAGPYKAGVNKINLPPFQRYVGDFQALAESVRTGKPLSVSPGEDLMVQEALLRASEMWS
jgi:predicted dehydrogenase